MATSTASRHPARPTVSTHATDHTEAATDAWSAAARHQLECSTLAFVAVLKSAEAMHRFLLESTHKARTRHESVRSRLHQADGPQQLWALQTELWSFDAEVASRYWQELLDVATHMNAELLDSTHSAMDHLYTDMTRNAPAFGAASLPPGMDMVSNVVRAFAEQLPKTGIRGTV